MIDARATGSGDEGGLLLGLSRAGTPGFDDGMLSHAASPWRKSVPKPAAEPRPVVPPNAQSRSFS